MKAEIIDIDEIQEIIISYANGNFSKRINATGKRDPRDTIAAGINMLGEELQETTISRDYFESIYDAVSDILIITNQKFLISDLNHTAENKLGYSKDLLIGTDARKLIKQESKELEQIMYEFKQSLRTTYSCETVLKKQNGQDMVINCSVSTIFDRRQNIEKGYLIIASDITEKKKQDSEVLKLVVSTQEEERKRLAYDLHDSLGQELNAIKMYLDTLDYMGKTEPSYDAIYKECKMMIEQSIGNIQNLSYNLMPKSLELVNLSYALSELCDKLGKLTPIQHNFDGKKLNLEKSTEIIIYRIFQEFINNTMKHARGATITLVIKKLKDEIQFTLRDDGPGFDITKIDHGNGVRNIRSRLDAINADYQYTGTVGDGTLLQFTVTHENN